MGGVNGGRVSRQTGQHTCGVVCPVSSWLAFSSFATTMMSMDLICGGGGGDAVPGVVAILSLTVLLSLLSLSSFATTTMSKDFMCGLLWSLQYYATDRAHCVQSTTAISVAGVCEVCLGLLLVQINYGLLAIIVRFNEVFV